MVKKYLEKLTELIYQIPPKKFNGIKLETKHFFSGAAVYANGNICISLTPIGFAIKLPEALRNDLMKQRGVKQLRYFSKGHIKKEYIVLPKRIVDDKKILRKLIKKSFEYVLSIKNKPN